MKKFGMKFKSLGESDYNVFAMWEQGILRCHCWISNGQPEDKFYVNVPTVKNRPTTRRKLTPAMRAEIMDLISEGEIHAAVQRHVQEEIAKDEADKIERAERLRKAISKVADTLPDDKRRGLDIFLQHATDEQCLLLSQAIHNA
jgi:hypothetical protein